MPLQSYFDRQKLKDMPEEISKEQLIEILSSLLNDSKFRYDEEIEQVCKDYPGLETVVGTLLELRAVAFSISRGSLDENVANKGYILSCLKGLQSNLNHLVWQLNQVSKGDFSQRIDFLGDFSSSFNMMCEKLQGQNQALNELARQDGLTKLANRAHLDEYMETLFDENQMLDTNFCLMVFDLDHFKLVNDTYGHDAGDIVLQRVAQYLRTIFRTSDFLARYGGEEFVAILPNIKFDQARVIAERALEYLRSNPIQISDDIEIFITASVGLSERAREDTAPEQVLKRSDRALYKAKCGGRNRAYWIMVEDDSAEDILGDNTTPIDTNVLRTRNPSSIEVSS